MDDIIKISDDNTERLNDERRKYILGSSQEPEPFKKATEIVDYEPYYKPPRSLYPALERFFKTVDVNHGGRITSKELQYAFETFQGRRFSESTCKLVVRLFDLDRNGGLDVKEFETLYYHVKQWVTAFNTYDRDKCGSLDEKELDAALRSFDVRFSERFLRFLISRGGQPSRRMTMDQFIVTCIQIQKFTDEFKRRDPEYTGEVRVGYEDFLEMVFVCL